MRVMLRIGEIGMRKWGSWSSDNGTGPATMEWLRLDLFVHMGLGVYKSEYTCFCKAIVATREVDGFQLLSRTCARWSRIAACR